MPQWTLQLEMWWSYQSQSSLLIQQCWISRQECHEWLTLCSQVSAARVHGTPHLDLPTDVVYRFQFPLPLPILIPMKAETGYTVHKSSLRGIGRCFVMGRLQQPKIMGAWGFFTIGIMETCPPPHATSSANDCSNLSWPRQMYPLWRVSLIPWRYKYVFLTSTGLEKNFRDTEFTSLICAIM